MAHHVRGLAKEEVDMPGRRISVIAALSALDALAACGDGAEKSKSLQTPEERIAAALDPCAEGRRAYAQSLCEHEPISLLIVAWPGLDILTNGFYFLAGHIHLDAFQPLHPPQPRLILNLQAR
jgi:hypothetical protein